ncbi:MAG: four helix bundle protein [Clostridia bacterium]|nr:four helix bundle protein [Clostridia bacterium]
MSNSILREKSKQFAIEIIGICREMRRNRIEYALIDQLLRSGTSIGANIHEAQFAQGTKDFISKFEIALKECNESDYWLEILLSTDSIEKSKCLKLRADCDEIRKMLISSVTTIKNKHNS